MLPSALVGLAAAIAFFLGAIIGAVMIVTKRRTRKDLIPFGPYPTLGSVITLLIGPAMLDWYLGFLR